MPPTTKGKLGGARPGAGRPAGLPPGTVKETKIQTTFTRAETAETETIKAAIAKHFNATVGEFFRALCETQGVDVIHVEKKVLGRFVKVGEYVPGEIAPENIEATLYETHGAAEYNIRAVHKGHYIGAPKCYGIGGAEAIARSEPTIRGYAGTLEDADAELAATAKRVSVALAVKTNQALLNGGEADEMKPETLLTLINASRQPPPPAPDFSPILNMMEASRREAAERSERLEQRNHELQMRMLDQANAAKKDETSTGLAALTALLPHAQGLLDNPLVKGFLGRFFARTPEPAGGWTPESIMGIISTVVNAAGPYIGPLLQSAMAKAAQPAENAPHAPALPAPTMPSPQNGGTPAMPNPITDVLIEELRKAPDDRNPEQLSRFLATVFVTPGVTLLGLFEELSDMDERFAKASITGQPGLFDPRLADAQTWPGVVAFFAFIREEAQKAEEEAKRASGE